MYDVRKKKIKRQNCFTVGLLQIPSEILTKLLINGIAIQQIKGTEQRREKRSTHIFSNSQGILSFSRNLLF